MPDKGNGTVRQEIKEKLCEYLKNSYPATVGVRKRDIGIAESETGSLAVTLYSYGRGHPARIDIADGAKGLSMNVTALLCNIAEGNLRRTFRYIRIFGDCTYETRDHIPVIIGFDCCAYGRKVHEGVFEQPDKAQPRSGDVKLTFRFDLKENPLTDQILDGIFEFVSDRLRICFHDIGGEAIAGFTYADAEKPDIKKVIVTLLLQKLAGSYLARYADEYARIAGHDRSERNHALLKEDYVVQKAVCSSLADKLINCTHGLSEIFEITETDTLYDVLKLELANLRTENGRLEYHPDPNAERVCREIIWEALHPIDQDRIFDDYIDEDEGEML